LKKPARRSRGNWKIYGWASKRKKRTYQDSQGVKKVVNAKKTGPLWLEKKQRRIIEGPQRNAEKKNGGEQKVKNRASQKNTQEKGGRTVVAEQKAIRTYI